MTIISKGPTESVAKPRRKYRRAGLTAAGEVPSAVFEFDRLPADARVRQPVVECLFSCSAATVWRRVKRGTLVPPRRLGRINTWTVGEIRKALEAEE